MLGTETALRPWRSPSSWRRGGLPLSRRARRCSRGSRRRASPRLNRARWTDSRPGRARRHPVGVIDPACDLGRRPRSRLREPVAGTLPSTGGGKLHRGPGSPTRSAAAKPVVIGRCGGHRWRQARRQAQLVLADGRSVSRGGAIGAPPGEKRRRRGGRRGPSSNTAMGAGYQEIHHRPVVRGARSSTFTYPHIGNYGVNTDDGPRARFRDSAASSYAISARPGRRNWRGDRRPSTAYLRRHHVQRPSRGSTRVASRATFATGWARFPVRSAPPTKPRCSPRHTLTAAPTVCDLATEVSTSQPYVVGSSRRAVLRGSPNDFGMKSVDPCTNSSGGRMSRRGRARIDPGRSAVIARCALDRRSSCRTGPGRSGRRFCRREPAGRWGSCWARLPVFRDLSRAPRSCAPAPRCEHVQAPLRPPRRESSGPQDRHRPGGDHEPEPQNYAVDGDSLSPDGSVCQPPQP